ncbi:pectinesterase [Humulus lupulus]|uniref:pectinesterase n=1 Tax=Humulus lupulus TaxID=3486 RepID=UPI002B4184BF|nr:pectinesterase [Humulus lupulus]
MAPGKVVVSAVSVVLVVGVALAVVAVVNVQNQKKEEVGGHAISSQTKIVESICSATNYKSSCQDSLKTVATNSSADFKDYVKAAMLATMDQVSKSMNLTSSLLIEADKSSNPKLRMSLEDCNDLLSFAIDQLQASFSMVGESATHTLQERVSELKSWLSSVITYAETCIDGVPEPKIQDKMKDTLRNASALTDNALAIVSGLSQILEAFGLKIDAKPLNGRRLLSNNDGFPTWVSASDRKLLQAGTEKVVPQAVVAKDGSGQYKTIAAALAAYPKTGLTGRYIIYVKAGVYDEYITVDKSMANVFMYGDGPTKTVVTGSKSVAKGLTTLRSASFAVEGPGFLCKEMGFENTAGPEGHQAVALRVMAEMAVFHNCQMDGYQDTLYALSGRQFYSQCVISGTVDFIFGDSPCVIQNSQIVLRRPMDGQLNAVTAQGRREQHQPSGIVLHNCNIVPEPKLVAERLTIKSYLGRPWREFSRTVVIESTISDAIQPAGWVAWEGTFGLDTLYYAEYGNTGPGAKTDNRVTWKGFHVISKTEAAQFTPGPFLDAEKWIKTTGVPFQTSLIH